MKNSTRRNFLSKSALVTLGAAATTNVALGETEAENRLKSQDQELAKVLRSYGRTAALKPTGYERTSVGGKTRRLPASRIGVNVRDRASFQASFEKLCRLSDQVHVEGNTVRFARGGKFYVIDNRVA